MRNYIDMKTRWFYFIILFLVSLNPGLLLASDDSCYGMQFRFVEVIQPQGFFGIHTPEANAKLVNNAFDKNKEADKKQKIYVDNLSPEEVKLVYGHKLKAQQHYNENYRFPLGSFCKFFKNLTNWGVPSQKVTFVCESDTFSKTVSRGMYHWVRHGEISVFKSSCYISTYQGDDIDLKHLEKFQLKPSIAHHSKDIRDHYDFDKGKVLGKGIDRYKLIQNEKLRQEHYQENIFKIVQSIGNKHPCSHCPFRSWPFQIWANAEDWDEKLSYPKRDYKRIQKEIDLLKQEQSNIAKRKQDEEIACIINNLNKEKRELGAAIARYNKIAKEIEQMRKKK